VRVNGIVNRLPAGWAAPKSKMLAETPRLGAAAGGQFSLPRGVA
jgi:hypothetical protein